MSKFTHLDDAGAARMVDVGDKPDTHRKAVASARVRTKPEVIAQIAEQTVPKGDVLAASRIAAIMAAKKTSEVIPLCHPLSLDVVAVDFKLEQETISINVTVKNHGKTGVEMEALTAACVAALTIIDMCKAVDREMVIEHVRLEEKAGGKSGHFIRRHEDE